MDIKIISTPLKIVYLIDDFFEQFSGIHPKYKDNVWGIMVGKVIFFRKNRILCNWNDAKEMEKDSIHSLKLHGCAEASLQIPTAEELMMAYLHKKELMQTISLLRQNGIDVDEWLDGWYWGDEYNENKAHVLDYRTGELYVMNKSNSNGLLRMVYSV